MGGMLSQKQEDGTWRPVDFFSQNLAPAERNYDVYNKEFLAIIQGLKEWWAYLLGAKEPFEIWTDHANQQYYWKAQKLKPHQMWWYLELQVFDYSIQYLSM